MKSRHLPLGIDIGSRRLRVVRAEAMGDTIRVAAVAVREMTAGSSSSGPVAEPSYVATLLEDAVEEAGGKERRCVCSIGEPDAVLRTLRLPKMSMRERERAAKFEAERHVEYPAGEAVVRLHRLSADAELYALGIARSAVLQSRVLALKLAKLKPLAVDHESCAFARAFGAYDGVIDIGYQRISLHAFSDSATPLTLSAPAGAGDVTRAIARDLSIDEASAEKRKLILGTVGAGETGRTHLATEIAGLIEAARNRSYPMKRIAFAGNGARLPKLLADVEMATASLCEIPVAEPLRASAYPEDVVRAAAPDWALACALAGWTA